MSAKRVLSPSLRVPNDDYHYQSMIVLMKNSRLLDKLIQMAPVMRINEKTLWALLRKKQRAIEKLHYLLKKVSSSKDSLEKHVSIFKRSLVEHWDLLSILENWRSRVHDLTMTPSGYGKRQTHLSSMVLNKPIKENLDIIKKESSLAVGVMNSEVNTATQGKYMKKAEVIASPMRKNYNHLKAEMILVGALQPKSTITCASLREFFAALNDKTVMLKLELFKQIADVRLASLKRESAKSRQNRDKSKDNSQYPYPAEFHPSNAVAAILSEYEPTPQGFYDTVLAGITGSKKEIQISQISPSVRYASERSHTSSLKNRKGGLETVSNDLSKTQKETRGKHPIVPSPKMPATRGVSRGAASKIASPLTRKTDNQEDPHQCVGNMFSPKTTGSKNVLLNSTPEEKKRQDQLFNKDYLKKTNSKS